MVDTCEIITTIYAINLSLIFESFFPPSYFFLVMRKFKIYPFSKILSICYSTNYSYHAVQYISRTDSSFITQTLYSLTNNLPISPCLSPWQPFSFFFLSPSSSSSHSSWGHRELWLVSVQSY